MFIVQNLSSIPQSPSGVFTKFESEVIECLPLCAFKCFALICYCFLMCKATFYNYLQAQNLFGFQFF